MLDDPDADDEPRPYTGTKPEALGCLATFGYAALLAMPLTFVWGWSGAHCTPAPQCQDRVDALGAVMALGVAGLAALLGFSVRAILRWGAQRRLDPRLAGRSPYWAFAAGAALISFAGWGFSIF